MVIPACFEHIKDYVLKYKSKKSLSGRSSQDDFRIADERSSSGSSSDSVKSRSDSVIEENKSNFYEEIQNGSPSNSNSSITGSFETLQSDRSPKTAKVSCLAFNFQTERWHCFRFL